MKKLAISKGLIVIVIGIFLCIQFYSYPVETKLEFQGYEISHFSDLEALDKIIVIDGWVKKSVFGKDKFMGNIIIDTMDFDIHEYIEIGYGNKTGSSLIKSDENMKTLFWGSLYMNNELNRIMVLNYDLDENSASFNHEKGSIIVAPSNDATEAKDMANEMLKHTFFSSIHIELPKLNQ